MWEEISNPIGALCNFTTSGPLVFAFVMFQLGALLKAGRWIAMLLLGFIGYSLLKNHLADIKSKENSFTAMLNLSYNPTEAEVFDSVRKLRYTYGPENPRTADEILYVKINELNEFFVRVGPIAAVKTFRMYGELPDLSKIRNNLGLEDEITKMQTLQGIDFASNYLMLALVTFAFFSNSARRGFFQKGLICLSFIATMILEFSLGQPPNLLKSFYLPFDEYTDRTFGNVVGYHQLEVPEIIKVLRLGLIFFLSQAYIFGLAYQPPAETELVSASNYFPSHKYLCASHWYWWSTSQAYHEMAIQYRQQGKNIEEFYQEMLQVKMHNHAVQARAKGESSQGQGNLSGSADVPEGQLSAADKQEDIVQDKDIHGEKYNYKLDVVEPTFEENTGKDAPTSGENDSLKVEPTPLGKVSAEWLEKSAKFLEALTVAAQATQSTLASEGGYYRWLGGVIQWILKWATYSYIAFVVYTKYKPQIDGFLFGPQEYAH